MKLVDIYAGSHLEETYPILLDLLSERTVGQSISHKKMPSLEEHCRFVQSRPYLAWYLIEEEPDGIVGAIYLSHMREVGLFIFNKYWNRGFGMQAIELLRAKHPGRLLANINPANERSIRFFRKLGFKHIQNTYELV